MHVLSSQRFLKVLPCFLMVVATGCAEFGGTPSWLSLQAPSHGEAPGIASPTERIAKLRKLAAGAARADAEQQQQVSAQLARQFEVEEDPLIRMEIVRALGDYRTGEANALLRAALEDLDAEVRVAACEALGKREGSEPAVLLGRTLGGDVDVDVRLAAARALGQSKDPAAISALGEALNDKDPAMQVRAVKSLRQVTGKDFGNDVGRWRQYVQTGSPGPAESLSMAERLRQIF